MGGCLLGKGPDCGQSSGQVQPGHVACTCWVQGPSPACLFCSRRYVWIALQGEPWSPDTHAKHPPAMRAAFRAALLCVARCTKVGCRTPGCWAFHANQSGWCCLCCIASRARLCSCSAAASVFLAGRTRAFAPPLGSVSVLPCSRCGAGGGRQGGAHNTAACCDQRAAGWRSAGDSSPATRRAAAHSAPCSLAAVSLGAQGGGAAGVARRCQRWGSGSRKERSLWVLERSTENK